VSKPYRRHAMNRASSQDGRKAWGIIRTAAWTVRLAIRKRALDGRLLFACIAEHSMKSGRCGFRNRWRNNLGRLPRWVFPESFQSHSIQPILRIQGFAIVRGRFSGMFAHQQRMERS
jgi:hypothetical protein